MLSELPSINSDHIISQPLSWVKIETAKLLRIEKPCHALEKYTLIMCYSTVSVCQTVLAADKQTCSQLSQCSCQQQWTVISRCCCLTWLPHCHSKLTNNTQQHMNFYTSVILTLNVIHWILLYSGIAWRQHVVSNQWSYSTLGPVSIWMDDCLRVGKPSRCCN